MNQKQFAAHAGYAPSYITQLKREGRLVYDEAGGIDAEATLARVRETADPARAGVAERHAQARAAGGTDPASGAQDAAGKIGMGYKFHQARKMRADADMAEVELAEKQRRLIPAESADFAIADLAAAVRGRLELLPAQLAPTLAVLDDAVEIEARLVEVIEAELIQLKGHLKRAAGQLKGEGA